MIVAVDTNVLLDVLGAEPPFDEPSAAALRGAMSDGAIVACEVVWAEVAAWFESSDEMDRSMARLGVRFDPLTSATAAIAGGAWHRYRSAGGPRQRLVADFLVGAHASQQAERLLTRDRGFFRRYYPGLTVIDPTSA